jgi:VanZ family protein
MEIIQAFLPYRDFSLGDILANTAGALEFIVIYLFFKKGT